MVRFPRQRLIESLPSWGGGAVAALAALFFLVLPDWRLESAVAASGLSAVLPFAAPPLGATARALLMLGGATIAGAVAWAALFLVWGPGGLLHKPARGATTDDAPVVRRADAHPDAPPRRPLSAADLGVPPPPAERPIPADLDQPLAAFHPAAIPEVPRDAVRPVAPLAQSWWAPEEEVVEPEPVAVAPEPEPELGRIETFELTPMVRPSPRAPERAEAPTVEALLRRLEAGTRRRVGQGG